MAMVQSAPRLSAGAFWFNESRCPPRLNHHCAMLIGGGRRNVDVAIAAPVHPQRTAGRG